MPHWRLAALAAAAAAASPLAGDEPGKQATKADAISGCTVGIVGAGWSGIYWAWRVGVDAKVVPAGEVCIFEAYARVGGRTYTVEETGINGSHLEVDVGAYRFAGDMHLPADLILKALELRTTCYDPTCKDEVDGIHWPYKEPLRKVIDEDGRNAGYETPLKTMLGQVLAAGGRLFRGHRLVALDALPAGAGGSGPASFQGPGAAVLRFSNGLSATVRRALLNLPRQVLLGIQGLAKAGDPRTRQVLQCGATDFSIKASSVIHSSAAGRTSSGGAKAYAYYEDAWWLSKLNLTRGNFQDKTANPPLVMRYHDGPVECARGKDVADNIIWGKPMAGARCRGALQVVYDFYGMGWWLRLQQRHYEPASLLTSPQVLAEVHERLMATHGDLLKSVGVDPRSLPGPRWIALGTWVKRPDALQPAPEKVVYEGGDKGLARECGVEGLTAAEYAMRVLSPVWPTVWLANNDFHAQSVGGFDGDWAQDSLLLAERVLRKLQVPAPAWLNATYYEARIVRAGGADSVQREAMPPIVV